MIKPLYHDREHNSPIQTEGTHKMAVIFPTMQYGEDYAVMGGCQCGELARHTLNGIIAAYDFEVDVCFRGILVSNDRPGNYVRVIEGLQN